MAQVKQGDTVKVHYIGKLADGTTFDKSHDEESLEFTLGTGQVLPGFESAVLGMEPGESKTMTIPSDDAYGAYDEEMLMEVDRNQLPSKIEPQVGQQLQVRQPDGETFSVIVAEIEPDTVTLDANHPLAGKDLTFEIMLVSIS